MPKQNYTSDLFDPQIFLETVKALEPARGLTLYNSVKKDTTPYPYVKWTTTRGSYSELAEYNVPNSKANLVNRQPGGGVVKNVSLAYMREGDYFTPTATEYLRDVQNGNESALLPAETLIAEQLKTVNDRLNNRIEWSLWQAAQGKLEYSGHQTGTFEIDYGMRAEHQVVLSAADQWDKTPSVESLMSVIRNARRTVRRDSGVDIEEAYLTPATLDLLFEAVRKATISAAYTPMLTDAMKNEYYTTGEITGFMGLNWKTLDQYYDVRKADGQGVDVKPYLDHGKVLFMNRTANNALKYTAGPAADFDAKGTIGRFAKNWTVPDPSGYQFLIEEQGLPVNSKPDQFYTVNAASSEWVAAQDWRA